MPGTLVPLCEVKGVVDDSIVYVTHPAAHRSIAHEYCVLLGTPGVQPCRAMARTSGAENSGVPMSVLRTLVWMLGRCWAIPKSERMMRLKCGDCLSAEHIRMFSGLTSRWTKSFAWR